MCSDFSLHLLQISDQLEQLGVRNLHSNFHFVSDDEAETVANKTITALTLSNSGSIVFIGTKSGNVYLLDISSFKLKDLVISQENILKSVQEELKKPGSVEAIAVQPNSDGKILIGFSRSLIVLWDYINESVNNYFLIEQVCLFIFLLSSIN